jgi:cyclase
MLRAPNRRQFLKTAMVGAAGISVGDGIFSHTVARAASGELKISEITDKLSLIGGAGANVTVLAGPDSLLLVDGGLKERSSDLLKAITDKTGIRKIQALFNTCWAPDHTGLNGMLGSAGTKITAHENTRLWLTTTFDVPWQGKHYVPMPKDAQPGQTFYTTGTMTFAGEPVEFGWLPRARTDGDIYVSFPASNVLVAGDVLSVGSYPILDYSTGGWLGGMIDASRTLLALTDKNTRIVPGRGPVRNRDDVQAQLDMVSTVKDRMVEMMRMGMSPEDMRAAGVTKEFDEAWGDPRMFLENAYRGLWGHVVELGIF